MNKIEISFEPSFLDAIRNVIREELNANKEALRKNPKSHSRREASLILGCSLPTLDKYRDEGKLEFTKHGRRIFISSNSIEKFLNKN